MKIYILYTHATNFKLLKKINSVNVLTLSNQRIEVFLFTQHLIHTIQTQYNHSQDKQNMTELVCPTLYQNNCFLCLETKKRIRVVQTKNGNVYESIDQLLYFLLTKKITFQFYKKRCFWLYTLVIAF